MAYSRDKPYNDLPLLPPNNSVFESIAVYKKLSQARAALAELKGRLPIIPNPYMLINTLVLQEAKDSSEIENVFTSADKMYRAFTSNRANVDSATKEVLSYRKALWEAFQEQQELSGWNLEWIVNIFKTVTERDESLRSVQVYIGNAYNTVYIPPESGGILLEKINNWLKFENMLDEIDPLIKMALLHYQFEAIHPFSDGNGRTGRILNVIYLTSQSLLELPVLYISKHILEYKTDYYRLLAEVTERGEWEEWILFMLEAVYQTSMFTLGKINAIFNLFTQVTSVVKEKAEDIYSRELIEIIFSQPYCKIKFLVDNKIASRNTASKYLNRLSDLGILEPIQEGNENLFLNKELYKILAKN
ncbi:MAG: Fic family protein [Spirochaetales bacterium]|nr:Fic family protein [Spirochaetales bacterium]